MTPDRDAKAKKKMAADTHNPDWSSSRKPRTSRAARTPSSPHNEAISSRDIRMTSSASSAADRRPGLLVLCFAMPSAAAHPLRERMHTSAGRRQMPASVAACTSSPAASPRCISRSCCTRRSGLRRIRSRFTRLAVSGTFSSASRILFTERTRLKWMTALHDRRSASQDCRAYDIWKTVYERKGKVEHDLQGLRW